MRMVLSVLLLAATTPVLAAERRYSVTDFDRVQVDGPFQVTLTTGGSSSARANGSSGALDRVSIDVQGRTLRVRPNASNWGGYPGAQTDTATIALTTRELQAATVNGSGTLSIDKAKGLKVFIALVGSGRTSVGTVESDALAVSAVGSGTISLGGKAKMMRADVHGSASLEGASLTADDAQVIADTAGTVKLAVARAVTVQASGAGDVEIVGTPACTIKASGSGQVRCGRR